MIYDLGGNPRFDLEHELKRFVPEQNKLAVKHGVLLDGVLLGTFLGALIWGVILFLFGNSLP